MRDVNAPAARAAAILLNVVCITYYNILPLVIGGAAGRGLAEDQLGFAAAAFMGGIAAVNFTGFAWIRRYDWRLLVVVGNGLGALAFALPAITFTYTIWLACNLLAGLTTGLSYGVSIACLGDTKEPERNFAFAYAAQTFISAGMIFTLPRLVGPLDLFATGQGIASLMMLIGAGLIVILPPRGAKTLSRSTARRGRLNLPHTALFMALMVLLLNVMAEGAIWAFIERIAVSGGLTTQFAASAMAFSFFASGAGSMLAATVATRLGIRIPFVTAVFLSVGSVWILWWSASEAIFFAGVMVFALAWNLGSPYRMALATRTDASGRFSTFIPAMQMLGAALGPAVAGLLVVGGSFVYVYVMCTLAWIATLILYLGAARRLRG